MNSYIEKFFKYFSRCIGIKKMIDDLNKINFNKNIFNY